MAGPAELRPRLCADAAGCRAGGGRPANPRSEAALRPLRSARFRLRQRELVQSALADGAVAEISMTRALVFPGQGSQSVGMGKELALAFTTARDGFAEIAEALHQR